MKEVVTFIKWNMGEGYRRNVYKYRTKREQLNGFNKVVEDLERLISEKEIVDFLVELV